VIDIFGAGATDWTPLSLLIGNPIDQVFDIYGTISGDTTEAGAEAALLDSLKADTVVSVYPNPSADRFVFNMGKKLKSKERLSLSVYNIAGSLVYHKSNLSSQFEWDASAFTRGFYFVNVSSESGISIAKMKILKK